MMMFRNLAHHPVRGLFTGLGMALATAILIVSLFVSDTMEQLIDVTYFMADRQDATLALSERRSFEALRNVARLPGVLAAEPYREVPVRIKKENIERRILISGRPPAADLSQIIDIDLRPVSIPTGGLAISSWLANILGVRVGDDVEIELLEGARRTVTLPVAALVEDYFGIRGMMDAETLARLMREQPAVNSVHVKLDSAAREDFFRAVKATPMVSGISLRSASLSAFRETVALLVNTMASIYTALAGTIAFGVIYNSARVTLSERARELASLRVLGFTQREVLGILLVELAVVTALAQPPGWLIGYGLAWIMRNNLAGELMRVRLIVEPATYVLASTIIMAAALFSALVIRKRVAELDLVAVLKTRE
jgi:putative ABC transport system permease protein